MSQPLPYGEFQWVHPSDEIIAYILSLRENSEEGFILEVDLDYPAELHDLHNDLPLAPERKKVALEELSPYARSVLQNKFVTSEKLIPNLHPKKNYILYHRNLQLYLKLGLKLVHVHKILRFKQKPWLKQYIDFNTEQRKLSKTKFSKDKFKLMNNAVYGKTMENVRHHIDVQLVNNEKRAEKIVASPTFKSFKIFDNDLVGVHRIKSTITLNKPIYVGFTILELSKLHMYNFHYNFIKKNYGEKANLLFTDTDSLTYAIETKDFYDDMKQHPDLFDTSDYPVNHPCYSELNKKKIGCFKDELNAKPILEFIGLRAKMYSVLTEEEEKKTLKGICRHVVKKKIQHRHYKECLFQSSCTREKQTRLLTENHHIFTTSVNKVALSCFDDKRYLLEDGITSYAYGHHRIP